MDGVVHRYWAPEGGEIPLIDAGFMPDPSGRWTGDYVPEMAELRVTNATLPMQEHLFSFDAPRVRPDLSCVRRLIAGAVYGSGWQKMAP